MSRIMAFARQLGAAPRMSGMPRQFEPVRDALLADRDVAGACQVLGSVLAADGWTLDEVLDGLEATYRHIFEREPHLPAVRAITSAWSEATLEFLHTQSCEDPLTGLASMCHLRARLTELYRAETAYEQRVGERFALTVVEPQRGRETDSGRLALDRELRLAGVAESMRAVYPASETVGRAGIRRVVAVVRRDDDLGDRVALLRQLLADWDRTSGSPEIRHRVWIEGLPRHHHHAIRLLDELAR